MVNAKIKIGYVHMHIDFIVKERWQLQKKIQIQTMKCNVLNSILRDYNIPADWNF